MAGIGLVRECCRADHGPTRRGDTVCRVTGEGQRHLQDNRFPARYVETFSCYSVASAFRSTRTIQTRCTASTTRGISKSVDAGGLVARNPARQDTSPISALIRARPGRSWQSLVLRRSFPRAATPGPVGSSSVEVFVLKNLFRAAPGAARPGQTVMISPTDTLDRSLTPPRLASPAEGAVFDSFPRLTTVHWTATPGAASYLVEWDFGNDGIWHLDAGKLPGFGHPLYREPNSPLIL